MNDDKKEFRKGVIVLLLVLLSIIALPGIPWLCIIQYRKMLKNELESKEKWPRDIKLLELKINEIQQARRSKITEIENSSETN